MRPRSLVLGAVLTALVLLARPAIGDIVDPGAPGYANNVLNGFVTPTVAPGETAYFAFNVSNPYGDRLVSMLDVVITVTIYKYATEEKIVRIDDEFSNPPLIHGIATWENLTIDILQFNHNTTVTLPIETSKGTPHGSYFMQSTYFVSFAMSYTMLGFEDPVVLKSRGCFSDGEWSRIASFEKNETLVNWTYLHELGVDGLLPDSSFGIKVPIPIWPLALIVVGGAGLVFVATYYYVLDNPGRHPRLEKRFYQLRGKLSELRSKLKHRGGK